MLSMCRTVRWKPAMKSGIVEVYCIQSSINKLIKLNTVTKCNNIKPYLKHNDQL